MMQATQRIFALFCLAAPVVEAFTAPLVRRHSITSRLEHVSSNILRSLPTSQKTTTSTATITKTKRRKEPWTQTLHREEGHDRAYQIIKEAWASTFVSLPNDSSEEESNKSSFTYMIGDDDDTMIEGGQIPLDLHGRGTLYRMCAGNFDRGGQRFAHILDGDGFVSALDFLPPLDEAEDADGQKRAQVQYRGRFVETEGFLREQTADTILYRNVFGTERKGGALANAFDIHLKNPANHNVMEWGGRLLALWDGGEPYELDPLTLETRPVREKDGPVPGAPHGGLARATVDFGGLVDRALGLIPGFSVHPHIIGGDDDDNGHDQRLVGIRAVVHLPKQKLKMDFVEFDRKWQETRTASFSSDSQLVPHDFAISRDHYIFFVNPLVVDNVPWMLGLKPLYSGIRIQHHKPSLLYMVPRNSSSSSSNSGQSAQPARQISGPPYMCLHMVQNIADENGTLTLYSHGWDLSDQHFFPPDVDSMPLFGVWGGDCPDLEHSQPGRMFRTVVDQDQETIVSHEQVIPGLCMEDPVIDKAYPHVIYGTASSEDDTPLPPTGYCKINTLSDSAEYWWADRGTFTGEPMAVAKQNGEPGSWILGQLYNSEKKRTSVSIFDSELLEDGPICNIVLRHWLPYGLHGFFASADSRLQN